MFGAARAETPSRNMIGLKVDRITKEFLTRAEPLAVFRFLDGLGRRSQGGFLAAAWDEKIDVEYTFYGLGTLALLARAQ